MPQTFETTLTANVKSKAKHVTKDGVEWLVVNGTLLVEGVHTGSNGPILYRKDFFKKIAPKWADVPIVKDHPTNDKGEPITANKGDFLKSSGMGQLKAPKDEPSLDAELWFDSKKTKKTHPDTHNALINGKPIEISTGLKLIVDEKEGEWEGEQYTLEAIDGDPDHLAVITNGEGACSNKKGCGVNFVANCGNEACDKCRQVKNDATPLTANAVSFSRVMNALSEYVYKNHGYNYYVRDVYPSFFVYRDGNGDLFKRTYTTNADGDVSIGKDEPLPVEWVTEYRTPDGKFVGNASTKENPVANKIKDHVDFLIANSNGDWTEQERDLLLKKPEPWLAKQVTLFKKAEEKPKEEEQVQNKLKPEEEKPEEKGVLKPQETMTEDDWLAKAPPSIRAVVNKALTADKAEHTRLVKLLTANKNVPFTEAYLKGRELDELQGLARMAGISTGHGDERVTPNYTGAALVQNVAADDEPEQALELKRPDFSHRLVQNGKIAPKK